MLKAIETLGNLVVTILALVVLASMAAAGWLGYQTYYVSPFALEEAQQKLADSQAEIDVANRTLTEQRGEIDTLNVDIEAKRQAIQRLETALRLLKVDHRIAQITVLSQEGSAAGGDLTTAFSFVELNEEGATLDDPRRFTINGDVVYVDAWVVKFTDDYVEQGDPLRATSVCLFRRIFGEQQPPDEGFVLDSVGSQPAAYRSGGKPSEFEEQIWSQFWEYANDAAKADEAGVRAAHGEAPSIRLRPGKRYKVLLRASGGLTVVPEDATPELPGPAL